MQQSGGVCSVYVGMNYHFVLLKKFRADKLVVCSDVSQITDPYKCPGRGKMVLCCINGVCKLMAQVTVLDNRCTISCKATVVLDKAGVCIEHLHGF